MVDFDSNIDDDMDNDFNFFGLTPIEKHHSI